MFVLVVIGTLGMPRASYGVFLAAVAAGALLGSLVAARALRRLGQARALRFAFVSAACVALVATPVGGVLGGAVAEVAGVPAAVWVAVAANVVALALLRPITAETIAAARAEVSGACDRTARPRGMRRGGGRR